MHARDPGEGRGRFSGRADDRGPAGARGPGRLTLRDRRAPYYNVTMNGRTAGGTAPGRRADIRPGDGGGDL